MGLVQPGEADGPGIVLKILGFATLNGEVKDRT